MVQGIKYSLSFISALMRFFRNNNNFGRGAHWLVLAIVFILVSCQSSGSQSAVPRATISPSGEFLLFTIEEDEKKYNLVYRISDGEKTPIFLPNSNTWVRPTWIDNDRIAFVSYCRDKGCFREVSGYSIWAYSLMNETLSLITQRPENHILGHIASTQNGELILAETTLITGPRSDGNGTVTVNGGAHLNIVNLLNKSEEVISDRRTFSNNQSGLMESEEYLINFADLRIPQFVPNRHSFYVIGRFDFRVPDDAEPMKTLGQRSRYEYFFYEVRSGQYIRTPVIGHSIAMDKFGNAYMFQAKSRWNKQNSVLKTTDGVGFSRLFLLPEGMGGGSISASRDGSIISMIVTRDNKEFNIGIYNQKKNAFTVIE